MATEELLYLRSEPGETTSLCQGEIVSDLIQAHLNASSILSADNVSVEFKKHSYAIVVSQACDLDQDFRARGMAGGDQGLVPNILFCEVFDAREMRKRVQNSRVWDRFKINKDERYHFFESAPKECDTLGQGLPELGVDFKRYFTVPNDEVYARLRNGLRRRCRLSSPYLEHFSTRFAYYQFRVALPKEHQSEPA